MTPEQRNAAIQAMLSADDPSRPDACRLLPLANPDAERYLTALTDAGYIVLHRDAP